MTGPRAIPAPTISEAAFLNQVLDLLRLYGYRTLHLRPALTRSGRWATHIQGDGVGWPDVYAVRGHRAVALELKSEKGKPTEAQLDWLAALGHAGVEAHVVRPSQWDWLVGWLR